MIKHIVFWKLKDSAEGRGKEENARKVKALLEGLNGKIPGMIHLEVGIDFSATESSSDIALYSEFESREALDRYQADLEHLKVKPFIKSVRSERVIVDYEA
ncbi:MAG: Dabb family protein [bacterium]|nr:Dabb family protein [bacterium]